MKTLDYVSIPQAAVELGRTRQTIWRHVKLGRVEGVRIGHTFVLRRKDMDLLRNLKPGRQARAK